MATAALTYLPEDAEELTKLCRMPEKRHAFLDEYNVTKDYNSKMQES
jgi:hypothetical protein